MKASELKMRKHQRELKTMIRQMIADSSGGPLKEKFALAKVACGGGKSVLPIIAYDELYKAGLVDSVCIVCPRDSLRRQCAEGFEDPLFRKLLRHEYSVNEATNVPNPARGLSGYVINYQGVGADYAGMNLDEFRRRRTLLCLDECHHVAEGTNWHKKLQKLVDQAPFVLLMTGSLERGDDKKIAFLPYKEIDEGKHEFDHDQIPTVEYSRKDGLLDGALIPVNNHLYTTSGEWERSGERTKFDDLSWLTKDGEIGAAIKTSLETNASNQILEDSLSQLDKMMKTYPAAKLLVVNKDIQSAKATARMLRNLGRKVEIATSDDSSSAQKAIQNFKFGLSNILVSCQIAYEGLDCKQIKVVCLLTHIRSYPWILQAVSRGTRRDPNGPEDQVCHVFGLKDQKMQTVMDRIKKEDIRAAIEEQEEELDFGLGGSNYNDNPIVPLSSVVKGSEWTDLDTGADLSVERVMSSINQVMGSEITLDQATKLAASLYGESIKVEERPVTPKEIEDQYRRQIEKSVRRIAAAKGVSPEDINRDLKREFGKSRRLMTNNELLTVLNAVSKLETSTSRPPPTQDFDFPWLDSTDEEGFDDVPF